METRRADDFDQTQDYNFLTNSQDLMSVCNYAGIDFDEITGAMVQVKDGELIEVWVTESSRPFDIWAEYERIV